MEDEFAPAARAKGLVMTFECPPDEYVDTDRLLFERICRNLLDNAVKYTDQGQIRLVAAAEDGKMLLRVADSGRGIPESEQARVFEEFYQLDNPERDRTRGFGLGLAIVKRLTDLLRVPMTMTSAPGKGTEFLLVLPRGRGTAARVADPQDLAAAFAGLRVLVVDDEGQVRLGMKTLLDGMGCRTTLCDGTAPAVAAATANRPDIVLADFRLRGDDNGIATVRSIRVLYPGMPAILLSGDTAPDRLREAEAAGIPLLHKPVTIDALTRAIADAGS
jgi:CheY-like chemotaxis protein